MGIILWSYSKVPHNTSGLRRANAVSASSKKKRKPVNDPTVARKAPHPVLLMESANTLSRFPVVSREPQSNRLAH